MSFSCAFIIWQLSVSDVFPSSIEKPWLGVTLHEIGGSGEAMKEDRCVTYIHGQRLKRAPNRSSFEKIVELHIREI